METRQFDDLAKAVGRTGSRRATLRAALGALLALAGLAETEAAKRRDGVGAEACIPTGKKCPALKPRGRRGKNGKPKTLGCDRCCQRRVSTNANGKTVCSCAATGQSCTETRECCDGVCTAGVCTTPSSPPPPGLGADACPGNADPCHASQRCCPPDFPMCCPAFGGSCCQAGSTCCRNIRGCCPPNSECCPQGSGFPCCPAPFSVCCPSGSKVPCCPTNTTCCPADSPLPECQNGCVGSTVR